MSGMLTLDPALITPSHISAVVARLRRFQDIMTLCPDQTLGGQRYQRVAARMYPVGETWSAHAAVVQAVDVGSVDLSVPRSRPIVNVLCYGSTGYEAERLANVVLAVLFPPDRSSGHFIEAHCCVVDVFHTAGPFPRFDPEYKLPYRVLTFTLDKSDLPVEAE